MTGEGGSDFFITKEGLLRRHAGWLAGGGASLVAAVLIYLTKGNLFVIPALCGAVIFAVVLFRHLELGIYILLAAALILEQFQIFGIPYVWALQVPMYLNLNLVTGIGPLVVNPVECLLGVMVLFWFIRATISREWHLQSIPNFWTAVVFLGMLVFFTLYGLATGGDFKVALWEIRALYYLCALYFLTSQVIRTRRQVKTCIWIIILSLGFKGMEGCWRFFVMLGGSLDGVPAITGHEDALFLSTAFILMIAFLLLGYRRAELRVLLAFFAPMFFTFIVTQRRVAYGTFFFSCLIVFAMLDKEKKIMALKLAAPFLLLGMVYTGVFWNSHSSLALPIQQVKSIFVEGEEEDSSNVYRKVEDYNLEKTIRAHPLGLGFGQKYLILIPLDKVDFPLWDYIPHNCLYWMWAKTGFVGFTIFWMFFGTALMQAVQDYKLSRDPYYKAVGLMVICFIFSQIVIAKFDLQITFYRNMIYLGTAMALLTSVRRLDAEERAEEDAVSP